MTKVFGKAPGGELLRQISRSAQFRNGLFHNTHPTSISSGSKNTLSLLWQFMNKPRNTVPPAPVPIVRTNLKQPVRGEPQVIWFGHSSYLIFLDGKTILVDPVFSGHASPFKWFAKAFAGADAYKAADMPYIDLLLITHDHYDHLDYETVMQLRDTTGMVCTSLGVSSHLLYWGFPQEKIVELDWWQQHHFNGLTVTATPARHFSGRFNKRFNTLWSSFVLQASGYTLYVGADSGYDDHFREIGHRFGPVDLAILECGQYNEQWPQIHMMPEETVQAAIDLQAKVLLPVHWGKFSISLHAWDEPPVRVTRAAAAAGVQVTTPQIGEPVVLNRQYPSARWWENTGT
jgi:L-ascorbate metabolism protein UlaG (beta-lactamase superfamily)